MDPNHLSNGGKNKISRKFVAPKEISFSYSYCSCNNKMNCRILIACMNTKDKISICFHNLLPCFSKCKIFQSQRSYWTDSNILRSILSKFTQNLIHKNTITPVSSIIFIGLDFVLLKIFSLYALKIKCFRMLSSKLSI